ncbi:hypothetical protein [Nostoc sp.]|uniref:hypothetical protein n=1 Tax=Nostoc sp. TaxID=1180 RepID=UPI0035942959
MGSKFSVNVDGGSNVGDIVTAQGKNIQQTTEINSASSGEKQLTKEDVMQKLLQIEEFISNAQLPLDSKEKATAYLDAAIEATKKEPPNKELAKVNLIGMANTLETASKTVASGKTLWENVKPVLRELPIWFDIAKSFFGL